MKLERRRSFANLLLIGPAALAIIIFMVVPLAMMAWISGQARSYGGGVHWGELTGEAWLRFLFERELDDSLTISFNYLSIIARSVWLSLITTVLSLAVGFPTAFFMATRGRRWRTLLVFMVTLPFWTNLLVRNYAWILILRDHGTINGLLLSLGIIDQPLPLLHNQFAVAASPTRFCRSWCCRSTPASKRSTCGSLKPPSIFTPIAGAYCARSSCRLRYRHRGGQHLVFIPSLGSYVTPELLGGGKTLMVGNLIGHQFGAARNWPFGAALGLFLLALVLLAMTLYALRGRGPEASR